MKKVLAAILSGLMLLGMAACGTGGAVAEPGEGASEPAIDEEAVWKVMYALYDTGLLWETWTDPVSESYAYDTVFTRFYCVMNPGHPFDIPASDYEPFIMAYFDVSAEELRAMDDYQADTDTYWVFIGVMEDLLAARIETHFRIDSIERENGDIKVTYWKIENDHNPRSGARDNPTFLVGHVLLRENGDDYRIQSVTITKPFYDWE